MIQVTTIKDHSFFLNPDLIYRVEEMPDTLITLTDGKTLVVKESAEKVARLVINYRKSIHAPQQLNE